MFISFKDIYSFKLEKIWILWKSELSYLKGGWNSVSKLNWLSLSLFQNSYALQYYQNIFTMTWKLWEKYSVGIGFYRMPFDLIWQQKKSQCTYVNPSTI